MWAKQFKAGLHLHINFFCLQTGKKWRTSIISFRSPLLKIELIGKIIFFVKYNYQIAFKILNFIQVFQVAKSEKHKKDWTSHGIDDSFRNCTIADSQMRELILGMCWPLRMVSSKTAEAVDYKFQDGEDWFLF